MILKSGKENRMKRKSRIGYVDIEAQTSRQRQGIGYDSPKEGTNSITIGEITKRLDDLIEMRNALASIEDDEQLSTAFDEFMVVQSSIIDSVFPILDRLSNVGALLLEYHQNDPGAAENKILNFWSESGYQIVRGYKITGTRFDTISDPPPDLVSELAGEDGFLPPYENEPD